MYTVSPINILLYNSLDRIGKMLNFITHKLISRVYLQHSVSTLSRKVV